MYHLLTPHTNPHSTTPFPCHPHVLPLCLFSGMSMMKGIMKKEPSTSTKAFKAVVETQMNLPSTDEEV